MNWNINWNIDLSWWHKQFVFLTNTNECNQFIHTMQAMNKAFLLLCGSCLNEIFQMWNYYHCSAGHHCFLVCIYVKKSYCSFCDEKKSLGWSSTMKGTFQTLGKFITFFCQVLPSWNFAYSSPLLFRMTTSQSCHPNTKS